MSYRGRGGGRGWGRGYGGSGYGYAKEVPFVCFPEGVTLPDVKAVTPEENLVRRSLKLQNYWKASPYYLEDNVSEKGQSMDIERFSDRNKVNMKVKRDSLSQILEYKRLPMELSEGSKGRLRQAGRKRVRWNPDMDFKRLDILEKLEQRQGNDEKEEKEKKEGEDEEEEDEDEENRDSEEELSDDDYYQNKDFDDDEDDFNIEDDGDDEQTY